MAPILISLIISNTIAGPINLRHNYFIKEASLSTRSFTIEARNSLRNCERLHGERCDFHLGWNEVLPFANNLNGLYKSQINVLLFDMNIAIIQPSRDK